MEQGYFIPASIVIEESGLVGKNLGSPEFRQFLVNLKIYIERISRAVNTKDTGYYNTTEFLTNMTYFSGARPNARGVFRQVVDFGTLPNAGTKTVAHNIAFDANYRLTRVYGAATDPVNFYYIPLPYVDVSGTLATGMTELFVDANNVSITTTGNGTNFTSCYVVIEYTKVP